MTSHKDNAGALARMGEGWNNFWFLPRDAYTLGLLRLLTGLVALWWYLSFYPNVQNWFGPEGLFTAEGAQQLRIDPTGDARFAFSYLDLIESASLLWFVYFLGLGVFILMTAGVLSRVSTILALVVVVSFLHRAPMLQRPVDDVLAIMIFYLCLGPSGASFSVDAWLRRKRAERTGAVVHETFSWSATLATRLLQVHIALIYAATALAQLQSELWWNGMAVWQMMARPESRLIDLTGMSQAGLAFTYFVNFLTHAVVLYEVCFALLIWNRTARPILLFLGVFFWIGLALIGGSVSYSVLMLVANLAFVEPATLRSWCARGNKPATAAPALATA